MNSDEGKSSEHIEPDEMLHVAILFKNSARHPEVYSFNRRWVNTSQKKNLYYLPGLSGRARAFNITEGPFEIEVTLKITEASVSGGEIIILKARKPEIDKPVISLPFQIKITEKPWYHVSYLIVIAVSLIIIIFWATRMLVKRYRRKAPPVLPDTFDGGTISFLLEHNSETRISENDNPFKIRLSGFVETLRVKFIEETVTIKGKGVSTVIRYDEQQPPEQISLRNRYMLKVSFESYQKGSETIRITRLTMVKDQ